MDPKTLETFDRSLGRCNSTPGFLDRFYERFLATSPRVREKFRNTDFVRQKRALRASFHMMLLAAGDGPDGPGRHLQGLAASHGRAQLDIGAEFYDYWLDSLLTTVRECDPEWDQAVSQAWEQIMFVGIQYLLAHYHEPPGQSAG